MSYLTTCTGHFTVMPAIPVGDLGPSRFLGHGESDAVYITRFADGIKWVTGIQARTDEPAKLYDLHEDLNACVREAREAGAEVDGRILEIGEEWWDVSRYVITSLGYVGRQRAVMRWPDGERVEIPDQHMYDAA